MKAHIINSRQLVALGLSALILSLSLATMASASEMSGTLSTNVGQSTGGTISGTVTGNSSAQQIIASGSSSGGRSGRLATVQIISDPIIIIDNGSIASGESGLGTGGGFDNNLERFLSGEISSDELAALSPSDAVAFNSQNPFLNSDLTAAAGETGMGTAKIWTAVILGLALLGLAGYAVNALISYRRENDL